MVKDGAPAGEAAMVGGARRRAAGKGRAPLSKKENEGAVAKTNMGFNAEADGFKVGPVTVLIMSLSFMFIVVALHTVAKMRSAMRGE